MPQLDFYTVTAQLFCLLLSIFLIYSFLLKYAMPAYDVYLRLKIKKLAYYRLQVENLNFLSLKFKDQAVNYLNVVTSFVNDFSKVYLNFLTNYFPILYYVKISKNSAIKGNINLLKPISIPFTHITRPVNKDSYNLKRDFLSVNELEQYINSSKK